MQVIHKNIMIEYCNIPTDFTGECEIQIPLNIWKKYVIFHSVAGREVPYSDIHMKYDKTSEYMNLSSPDVLICFYYWALNTYEKEINLMVCYDHISWVYHDLMHAENDCDEDSINVYSEAERKAILYGLQKAYDVHKAIMDYETLAKVCTQYNQRHFKDGYPRVRLDEDVIYSEMYLDLMEDQNETND